MENLIYANGYRVTITDKETQLLLRVESPIVDEEKNEISGTTVVNVADVRMSTGIAKELYLSLKGHFECFNEGTGE